MRTRGGVTSGSFQAGKFDLGLEGSWSPYTTELKATGPGQSPDTALLPASTWVCPRGGSIPTPFLTLHPWGLKSLRKHHPAVQVLVLKGHSQRTCWGSGGTAGANSAFLGMKSGWAGV